MNFGQTFFKKVVHEFWSNLFKKGLFQIKVSFKISVLDCLFLRRSLNLLDEGINFPL